jgi:hypothetical protein
MRHEPVEGCIESALRRVQYAYSPRQAGFTEEITEGNRAGSGPACLPRRLGDLTRTSGDQLDGFLLRLAPFGLRPARVGSLTRPHGRYRRSVPVGATCGIGSRTWYCHAAGEAARRLHCDGDRRRRLPGDWGNVRSHLCGSCAWGVRDGKRHASLCGPAVQRPAGVNDAAASHLAPLLILWYR